MKKQNVRQNAGQTALMENKSVSSKAVSYTHLDVYKRQN